MKWLYKNPIDASRSFQGRSVEYVKGKFEAAIRRAEKKQELIEMRNQLLLKLAESDVDYS